MPNAPENFIIWPDFERPSNSWWKTLNNASRSDELLPFSDFWWWRAKKWIWVEGNTVDKNIQDKWEVNEGYDYRAKVLVPVFDEGKYERYNPSEENPALFLEVQKFKGTKDGIKEFVTKWGPLNAHSRIITPANIDLVQEAGVQFVERDGLPILSGILPNSTGWGVRAVIFEIKNNLEIYEAWKKKDKKNLIALLKLDEANTADENIIEEAESRLIKNVNSLLIRESNVCPMLAKANKSYHFSIMPYTLEAFLLLQFAYAITKKKNYKPCLVCGKTMETSQDKRTQKKKFCSSACTMKNYRERKATK